MKGQAFMVYQIVHSFINFVCVDFSFSSFCSNSEFIVSEKSLKSELPFDFGNDLSLQLINDL